MESSVGEKYPNPSHTSALISVTLKLCGRDKYVILKSQMLCLLDSHHINGKLVKSPQISVTEKRSDALVKCWILGSLSEHTVWLFKDPILEATSQNAYHESFFPKGIWSANEDGHNILDNVVVNLLKRVYNLLYQMRTIKDSFGNNLLHFAARLAPTNKLDLIPGQLYKYNVSYNGSRKLK